MSPHNFSKGPFMESGAKQDPYLPTMIVFDLVPGRRGDTVVSLYDGARQALYQLATDPAYRGILLAAASTSLEPKYSDACLRALEILPGLTVHDMLSYRQIGRDGVLTSDKRTHFRLLHQESGVPYTEMLFFDDCNWGDHVGTLWRAHGVVGQRTPAGLTFVEFEQGLARYRKQAQELEHAVISNPSKKQKSPRKKT